ncbi:J domain-containing protein [Sphingomonas sp.]|uniref:J domain-containing protein n=1 Tax=Sphingomonas sp. TaxID=28214 RepID=UPI003CC624B6
MKLFWLLLLVAAAWFWFKTRSKPAVRDSDLIDARAVLGVDARADADAIRAAHRRLLGGVHPDRGGSAELTRQINAARDLLLRRAP